MLLLVSTFPQDFNPRLREGGDGFYWSKHCKRCLISIHASAKEATFEHLLYVLDEHIFQSTPPRRRRRLLKTHKDDVIDFNPRLREGGDTVFPLTRRLPHYFNPRLREGGDLPEENKIYIRNISIHASAKEATALLIAFSRSANFNPRLREGGDGITVLKGARREIISIHASAKEATPVGSFYIHFLHHFNPRLREGGDPSPLTVA